MQGKGPKVRRRNKQKRESEKEKERDRTIPQLGVGARFFRLAKLSCRLSMGGPPLPSCSEFERLESARDLP